MKLFEQLKSNASRMAVYAILVATALCGIAAPGSRRKCWCKGDALAPV